MNIFWRQTIEKSCSKFFSGTSGISYCSKTCSNRPGLSIAPTPDRFGHVQAIKDTIKKSGSWWLQNPLLKRTHKCWPTFFCWKIWHLIFLYPCRTLFYHSYNTFYDFVKIYLFFEGKILSEKTWKIFFIKNSAKQHLLTKCKLCWWKHMGLAPLNL